LNAPVALRSVVVSWSKRFDVPIVLQSGEKLETLADARAHLLSLPKSKHQTPAVEAAIEALMMAAEGRGPVMHANADIARLVHGTQKKIPEPQPSKEKQ
jgi:hypothetical protein